MGSDAKKYRRVPYWPPVLPDDPGCVDGEKIPDEQMTDSMIRLARDAAQNGDPDRARSIAGLVLQARSNPELADLIKSLLAEDGDI